MKDEQMRETPCPYFPSCLFTSNSKNSIERHLLFQHDVFSNNENIKEAVIRHLNKISEQVEYLLLKLPQARSPHNWALYLEWIRHFSVDMKGNRHLLVWDSNKKLYCPNPNEGWSAEQLKAMLQEMESISRSRRKIQERDRKNYHGNKEAHYEETETHHCVLPTQEQVYEAKLSEEAHRSYYADILP